MAHSLNVPSARTLDDSEKGSQEGDRLVGQDGGYPYDNMNSQNEPHPYGSSKGSFLGANAPKILNIVVVFLSFVLLVFGAASIAGANELHKSVENVSFNCNLIFLIGLVVTIIGIVGLVYGVIMTILLATGRLMKFHRNAFCSGETGCTKAKCFAITNVFVLILLICFSCIGTLASFSFYRLSTQVTDTNDPITLTGKDGPITLARDEHGLPRIRANTKRDAFFAQGYAQAADRLWELEFTRLVVQGRMSEMVGDDALTTDKQTRTLGFRRAAEEMCNATSAKGKALFQSFVDGINHFLDTRKERPVEFAFMGKPKAQIIPSMRLFDFHEPEHYDINLVCYAAKLVQWVMSNDAKAESERFKIWWMNPSSSMKNVSQLFNNFTNNSHTILNSQQLNISEQDIINSQRRFADTFDAEAR